MTTATPGAPTGLDTPNDRAVQALGRLEPAIPYAELLSGHLVSVSYVRPDELPSGSLTSASHGKVARIAVASADLHAADPAHLRSCVLRALFDDARHKPDGQGAPSGGWRLTVAAYPVRVAEPIGPGNVGGLTARLELKVYPPAVKR